MPFFQPDSQLQTLGDRIVSATCDKFQISSDRLAVTLLVYQKPSIIDTAGEPWEFWSRQVIGYSHRGEELIYPASIVKLFYLVALHEWLERGMLQSSPEIERACKDMIVDSSNDATGLIVDVLTGTTGGPELPEGPFTTWKYQRQIVNRYLHQVGVAEYNQINVCQKTWGDGPYGRERAFYGADMENRNMLTTNATAHLVHSIISGMAISRDRCQAMRSLMERSISPEALAADPLNQVTGFLGAGLPKNARLWSKAGETSQVRHDAAYVEIPDKSAFTLVVFTEGDAKNESILPFFASQVVEIAI